MMLRLLAASVLAFPLSAIASPISVMTFDGIGAERVWVEDGITATAPGGLIGHLNGGYARIERLGPSTSVVDFTMDTAFVPLSMDILPGGSQYCADGGYTTAHFGKPEACLGTTWDDPIPYVWISGFRDGTLVESDGVYLPRGTAWDWEMFSLANLGPIDMLRIEIRNYFDLGLTGVCASDELCGSVAINNLRLVSVPEPTTLSLLAVGLVGLVVRRRRRSLTA